MNTGVVFEEIVEEYWAGAEAARVLVATRGWDSAYGAYATGKLRSKTFSRGFKAYLDATLEQESAREAEYRRGLRP